MITMSSSGIGKLLMPRQIVATVRALRDLFRYARSEQDTADPAVRVARVRAEMEALLLAVVTDLPRGALDPFLDYLSEQIAAGTAPEPDETPSQPTT